MQLNFRGSTSEPAHVDRVDPTSHASPVTFDMPQRRLNDFLDALSRRFQLHDLQARDTPGAGVTLENGDAVYFRANGTLDTFDLYFRIALPPAARHHADLIPWITTNCFSGNTPARTLFMPAAQDCVLFGITDFEYDATAESAASRLDRCFSEYQTLIAFLRSEVH
ncbi:hypothetical protein PCA31118_01232 [Pandoraea captiosa]|uniref:Uncharacterized protein n=1 Tax=Pandoraea captiosa TaxID=2508302 RepID=A0A5E4ZQ54_9BURK|nr:hypothetical protein [Pandoraea captiosa]VVE63354.1 hypothetical protein PCA31118_01232 [Pandoraea captiosa]